MSQISRECLFFFLLLSFSPLSIYNAVELKIRNKFWKNNLNSVGSSSLTHGRMNGSCTKIMLLQWTTSIFHLFIHIPQNQVEAKRDRFFFHQRKRNKLNDGVPEQHYGQKATEINIFNNRRIARSSELTQWGPICMATTINFQFMANKQRAASYSIGDWRKIICLHEWWRHSPKNCKQFRNSLNIIKMNEEWWNFQ